MNVSIRFIVLLLVAVVIFAITLYEFQGHLLFWAVGLKGLILKYGSYITTRAFWESVPLFLGKWSSKALSKTFVKVLMRLILLLLNVVLVMFLFDSRKRKSVSIALVRKKSWLIDQLMKPVNLCKRVFGVNGYVSFVISAMAASLMFFLTFTWLNGWGLFVWFGSWGPLAPVGTAVATLFSGVWIRLIAILVWFGNGLLYRVPYVGVLIAKCGEVWLTIIAPRLTSAEKWRRRQRYRYLRGAYRARQHRIKVYYRWEVSREARKKRIAEKREMLRLQQAARFLWTSAARPLWERRFWRADTFLRLKNQAPAEAAERIYLRRILGADVHQGLLHGGHSHWRVVRR